MRSKKELRALVADAQLEDALEGSIAYADAANDLESLNGLHTHLSDLRRYKEQFLGGQIAFEEYARAQARISAGLLHRIAALPDAPERSATRRRIREERFRWQVFYLFLTVKSLLFGWILFVWQVEGMSIAQFFVLCSALLPGVTVHLAAMFRSLFRSSVSGELPPRFVATRFRNLVWLAFLAYLLVQVVLVTQKANGNFTFEQSSAAFIGSEGFFGLFIAEIIKIVMKDEG